MRSHIECVPCILNSVIRILNEKIEDVETRHEVFRNIIKELGDSNLYTLSPPVLTAKLHEYLKEFIGSEDLYKDKKVLCNKGALEIYPHVEELYNEAEDKLESAIKIAISGNLIDYGALNNFDINSIVDDYVHRDFAINNYTEFKADLEKATNILYIGDNTGEIVLDRLLIKHLIGMGKKVVFTVKSAPILNDALIEDAIAVGMTEITDVIESGCVLAGTTLAGTNELFHKKLAEADMVIAKGQGNFETLTEETLGKPLYYLFLCKCDKIATAFGTNKFDLMLLNHGNYKKYF